MGAAEQGPAVELGQAERGPAEQGPAVAQVELGAVAELGPAEQGSAVAQVGAASWGQSWGQAGPELAGPGPVSESREGPPHPSQQQTDSQLFCRDLQG